jgi:drug/metabolite transporter (DMT)-like permease
VAAPTWTWGTRAAFLLLVLFWGLNYPFVNLGLESASPLWLASLRAGLGAVTTLAVVSGRRAWGTLDRRGRRDALLLGLPNTALFFGPWFWAARDVTPGIAAVIIYTFPLWVALLSFPVLGRSLRGAQWAAVVVGFGGVALISQVGVSSATVSAVSAVALLGAAIAWAIGTVLFQRRFRREQMLEANAYQLVGGTAALLAATWVLAPLPLPTATADLAASLLWMGLLGTAAAYAIWFTLLGRTPASTLSAYVFLVPVVALAASAAYFGERLTALQILGVGLVLVSIYGIARSPRRGDDAVDSGNSA